MNGKDVATLPQEEAVAQLAARWSLAEELARRRLQRELESREPDMRAAALEAVGRYVEGVA